MVKIDLSDASELIQTGVVICRKRQKSHTFGIFYGQNPLLFSFPLVLLQVTTVIVVTRLLRFLLKPLRQPKVVSEILGGIIVGPSVLGRSKKFQAYVFPDNATYVIKNLGLVGFMYFLFLSAVKMDLTVVSRVISRGQRKHWYIAMAGVLVPLCCVISIAFIVRGSLDKETEKVSSILGISSFMSGSSFPVLYRIMQELNLLSSGIGRLALSTSVVSDVLSISVIMIFEGAMQGQQRALSAVWYLITVVIVVGTTLTGVRRVMIWIVRTTPEGKPVDQIYVIAILLGVMITGFISDMFGLTIVNGPLWLGLAVPDGPPLGTILVEKSELIVRNILMPFSFMYIGLIVDVSTMSGQWSHLRPILLMLLVSHITKMVSTFVASRFFDLMIRDSFTLSLIMGLKGEVEILLFLQLIDTKIFGPQDYAAAVLSVLSVTGLATPMISILYDPTRPYMLNKRRNIQHTPPNSDLHVVVCIHGEENLPELTKLLEVSNPTVNNPLSVYAICLVELVGRCNPVLIDHGNEDAGVNATEVSNSSGIHNALRIFKESRGESMKIFSYTTITSQKSMYQDVCELALSKKACLIILPTHKQSSDNLNETITTKLHVSQSAMNTKVLENTPCSVGILVDKSAYHDLVNGSLMRRSSIQRIAVIFLGGPDCREALTYADRMAENQEVSLSVVRFLSHENEGDVEAEKKLDDGLVTWFWVKSEGNNRIVYREVVVRNGEETIAAIQTMNRECYHMWIVGRKHGINPVFIKGLSNWSENNELGVIGDYLASVDFDSKASVLVVQQQILFGQEKKVSGTADTFTRRWFPFLT